ISNSNMSDFNTPIEISGGSPIISGNNISAAQYVEIFGNEQSTETGISLSGNNNAVITDNIITGFNLESVLLGGGSPIIQRNEIGSERGVEITLAQDADPTIQNNTFDCSTPIEADGGSGELTCIYNNFNSRYQYNIYWGVTSNLNATYNWWGTTDQSVISNTIYDFNKDFSLGTVS